MIPLARLPLVTVLGMISVVAVGLVFGQIAPAFADLSQAIWLVVLIELIVYFLGILLSNPSVGPGRALFMGLFLCVIRLFLSGISGIFMMLLINVSLEEATLRSWVGNPAGAFIQVFLLMLVAPHALQGIAPGLVSDSMRSLMDPNAAQAPTASGNRAEYASQAEPVGGSIQVFSFQELQSIFRKSVGMEGFIIFTSEGLVLWKDMPIRLDVEALVARTNTLAEAMGGTVESFGLNRVRKVVLESRDHYLFQTRLNPNFGLIMVFASGAKIEDCWVRLGIMAKTTKEYLQWKYPNLGTLRDLTHTQVPSET